MTVADLIEKLTECNPEAEVMIYNQVTEDDGRARVVEEYNLKDYVDNHYCQGDTEVDFVAGKAEDFYLYKTEECRGYGTITVRDGINPKYNDVPIVVIKNW